MMIFRGGFRRRQLAILLAVAVAACKRDSATEPVSPDSGTLRISAASPTQLEGTVGEPVNLVPTVIVRSETGRAVPGIQVLFIPSYTSQSVVRDSVTNRIVTTDSHGVASAGNWTLGTTSGLHDLEARIFAYRWSTDPDRVVAFHADAKAAAPAVLSKELFVPDTVGVPGDQLSPPMIRVTDRFGNGVGGVAITFSVASGGGSLAKTYDETSRFGSASPGKWTLGLDPGVNSVVASAPGLNSVTFSARALDVGAVVWYDLVPQSVNLVISASIALCEDGTFELVTVDDLYPGEWLERLRGKYTLAGTVVVLTFSTGVTEQGTLVDHSLSLMHVRSNWAPLEEWRFVKR